MSAAAGIMIAETVEVEVPQRLEIRDEWVSRSAVRPSDPNETIGNSI